MDSNNDQNKPLMYTNEKGEQVPVETLNNFHLVNGLVKYAKLENDYNVSVLKEEILKRLNPNQ